MKRISLFETSDGQTFQDRDDARLHEAKIAFHQEINTHFFPIMKAAPESSRFLLAMAEEPEIFLSALTTYAKLHKKLHKTVMAE